MKIFVGNSASTTVNKLVSISKEIFKYMSQNLALFTFLPFKFGLLATDYTLTEWGQ